ncbi:putative Bleomycin hydrolase [Rhodotorula taiwanensis]|uniref:Cysteine proteinase 1, mitochondrial n=1 Tax=Rhodotorula taiwanensis TaxID=741276 RepID=A0A2S5BC11_9BASI|nr:putative Bleomycin hydrolase [Rhodotorula taiwanensis]
MVLALREIVNVPITTPHLAANAIPAEKVDGTIKLETIHDWHDDLASDRHYKLAQTILCHTNPAIVLGSRDAKIKDDMLFNTAVSLEGEPIANQLSSGRCWLFAMCNVVRIFTTRKFNLGKFELSQASRRTPFSHWRGASADGSPCAQSYLFFYDHLSKANWFLEQVLDLAGDKLDSRKMQFLFSELPAQDGGQWDLAVSLVENFGLVPQHVFPESWSSSNSGVLDTLLTSKLREMGLHLRKYFRQLQAQQHPDALEVARRKKEEMLKVIYRILTINLGTPPKPDQLFLWEFKDKKGDYQTIQTTPLEFARIHSGYDVSNTVSLLHDPRNPFRETYTIDRLGNVVGGRDLVFLNLPMPKIKRVAIAMLKADIPVWFGCDGALASGNRFRTFDIERLIKLVLAVDKASDTDNGFMDTKLRDFEAAYGTELQLDKKERLLAYDTSMTHAMMFTGVHIDPLSKLPVRWRVENSWGPEACNKGFLVMTDEWFDEYVFQIAAPREFVDHDLLDIYDNAQHHVLPMWDTLASIF